MFKSIIKLLLGEAKSPAEIAFPTETKMSSRGVQYTKISLPLFRNLKAYSPHYQYSRFKEMYQSLYAANPLLVEELFQEYEKTFCGGDDNYLMVRNFIIGYQLLHGMHITGVEYSFDHRLYLSESKVDQLRIDFPDYRFRYQKGYEGDDFWCVIYLGDDVPSQDILSVHHKLGSK